MRKLWTDEERKKLAEIYPHNTTKYCAEKLGRTTSAVSGQANKMGLKKSQHHLQHSSGRIEKGRRVSKSTEFKKGQTPWNKGLSYMPKNGATRFKKGNRPHTWRPIGSERINKEGCLVRKVSDTGVARNDWRLVHHLLWIERYGEIPKKHVLRFKDGNPKNIAIDNLELITMAENAKRNSIHRYPPELRSAMRQLGWLKREVRKHEQNNN